MAASKIAMASLSLTHFRPLSSASTASVAPSSSTRLIPRPPDLINWVRREGGFVHQAVKIAQHADSGLGLVASDHIPTGSELIVLPHNLPLRFESPEAGDSDEADSVLVNLARQVPGNTSIEPRFLLILYGKLCLCDELLLVMFFFLAFFILVCVDFCTLNFDWVFKL